MPPSATDAFTALNAYQAPSAADVLTQADTKYGVGDLATRVQNLQTLSGNLTNSIAAVDPSVTARTAGTLTNEGQRSALVNREQAPLLSSLASNNTSLDNANTQLGTARQSASDEANAEDSDNQSKYQKLLDTYNIANAREAAQAAAQAQAAQEAEAEREFNAGLSEKYYGDNLSAASSAASSATNPAAGYSVKQLSSGNKAYTGPNGQTNLYQYASAIANGDPSQTYNVIKQQLSSGSATDKGAYNGILKEEKAGISQSQIIANLKKSNGYIFN